MATATAKRGKKPVQAKSNVRHWHLDEQLQNDLSEDAKYLLLQAAELRRIAAECEKFNIDSSSGKDNGAAEVLSDVADDLWVAAMDPERREADDEDEDTADAPESSATPAPPKLAEADPVEPCEAEINTFPKDHSGRMILYEHLRNIQRALWRHYPEGDGIRQMFDFTLDQKHGENRWATLEELKRLHREFYALPEPEQRRVLNGWKPDPELTQGENLKNLIDNTVVNEPRRGISISVNGSGAQAYEDYRLDDGIRPVDFWIRDLSTKDEVLSALAEIDRFVRLHFEAVIADPENAHKVGQKLKAE